MKYGDKQNDNVYYRNSQAARKSKMKTNRKMKKNGKR
jgi:hypothetical protein